MRRAALCVGAWCGISQISQIYLLSFFFSAAAPAFRLTLMCWFAGGAVGCSLPATWKCLLLFVLATALQSCSAALLWNCSSSAACWLAAGACGAAASHWLRLAGSRALARTFAWESAGTGLALAFGFIAVYLKGVWFCVLGPWIALALLPGWFCRASA